MNNRKGFTLVELLIIIAIIGFLAAAVLVAVNPVRRIQDARNARRAAEVNSVLNAILKKQVDDVALYSGEVGALLDDDTATVQVIVRTATGVTCTAPGTTPTCGSFTLPTSTATSCVANLSALVPEYIAELPIDPRGDGAANPAGSGLALGDVNTGYYINRLAGNRIEIGVCAPEGTSPAPINVKR
jgi:prepilin-type N-terminal cleavage/methylation domain-containing protein